MPKVSWESAQLDDHGVAEDRHGEIDGCAVSFVSIRETHDLAPLLKGLPDDRCQCPHWGYVLKGRLIWRFADREEVCEAGDAFYVPPGHVPEAEAGSEFIQFSPTEELRATEAAMMKNMQAMQGG
jgi:AraC-like ligand binding domain